MDGRLNTTTRYDDQAEQIVGRRSFGPNKTGPHKNHQAYTCIHHRIQLCSRWYDHEWLKADYKPDSPPPPPHPQPKGGWGGGGRAKMEGGRVGYIYQ